MRALEAKQFLVQQTAEQAALENVPLSDLEKRMMYFTEVEECPEDPIALNEEFEAEYDTEKYEAKISKLMRHARQRIKKGNPEATSQWKEAIRELSKGDHYILILCGEGLDSVQVDPTERPPHDFLKLLGTAILVVAAFVGLAFLGAHFGIFSAGGEKGRYHARVWLQRLLVVLYGRRLHLRDSAFDFEEALTWTTVAIFEGFSPTKQEESPPLTLGEMPLQRIAPKLCKIDHFRPLLSSIPSAR